MEKQTLQNSQYRLRKLIGYLGILLPVILFLTHLKLLSSISHYYYTTASIFFIGILFAFGLILIAYKGYPLDPRKNKRERFSDKLLTTIAGICIIVAVIIPTNCEDSLDILPFCGVKNYLFGHQSKILSLIHLIGAGGFLFILGYMCIKKFTRSNDPKSQKNHRLYKISGYLVLGSVGMLICLFIVESIVQLNTGNPKFSCNQYFPGYTFILETIAVWAFAIAWLIKGKIENDIDKFKSMLTTRKPVKK